VRALLLLLVITALLSAQLALADVTVTVTAGYPSDLPSSFEHSSGCEVIRGSESVIFECPSANLLSGIVVAVNSTEYSGLYVSYSETTHNITIVFYKSERYSVEVYVQGGKEYFGRRVGDIQLELWEYDPANYTIYVRVVYSSSYTASGSSPVYIYRVRLLALPYVTLPPPPGEDFTLPAWYDIPGWIALLIKVLATVAKPLASGLYLFALMIYYFANFIQYVAFFIPLHIVFSFIHSVESGLRTIKFYMDVGRKMVDLFVKVAHVLVSAISAILPF